MPLHSHYGLRHPEIVDIQAPMQIVRSANLTLEPQLATHAEAMFPVLNDPASYEYESEQPASVEWLRARFAKLESRRSPDGREQWLNWVIRCHSWEVIGFVQATVRIDDSATIAYVITSSHWGRGIASEAVQAMMAELAANYRVRHFSAVFKRDNLRSMHLLERLGFALASPEEHKRADIEAGELLMKMVIPHA